MPQLYCFGGAPIKSLEIDKNLALTRSKGNLEKLMSISSQGRDYISWWLTHMQSLPNPIRMGEPIDTLTTDASLEGWGAHVHTHTAGRRWMEGEAARQSTYR